MKSTGRTKVWSKTAPSLLGNQRPAGRSTLPLNWSAQLPIKEWEGIRVSAHNLSGLPRVTGLALAKRGLTGFIPPEIGKLTHLYSLWLGGNELSGELPAELGKLTEMGLLSLHTNDFTGEIPPELGQLYRMFGMSLEYNRLTGQVPPELTSMQGLEGLWLNGNSFEGCIPHTLHGTLDDLYLMELPSCPGWQHWGSCFYGGAIEKPVYNPGLVHDCSVLLEVKQMCLGPGHC